MINNVKMSAMRYNRCNRIYYRAFGGYNQSRQMFTHHMVVLHKAGLLPWRHRRFMKLWRGNYQMEGSDAE